MAQTYTRQSTLADGDTITASLFNDEYNQLVNVFAYSSTDASSTGHRHDGTTAQGGNIPKIGDLDFLNKIEVDSTNNRWGFYVEVSSAAVEQIRIQDGAIVPVTDDDIDLGTSSLEFKDLYIDGTANIDTLSVDTSATIAGLTVSGTSTLQGDVYLGNASADTIFVPGLFQANLIPENDSLWNLGSTSLYWANAYIDAITTTGNVAVGGNLTVTGTTTFNGGTITMGDAASDNVVFGADVNSNIIPNTDNTYDLGSSSQEWKDIYIDGTAYLDAINFNGTAITATAAELNIMDGVTATATEINLLDGVTSTTAELNILDGVTSTAVELNILDGVTSTATELNLLDGVTSTTAELNILDGVTSTATELNIVDGDTTATSTTLADADRVVVNDNGTMVQVALTDFETYFESALDTLSNVTTVGALNAGSITSGFGAIDNGSSAITTTGTVTYGSLSDGTITVTAFVDEDDMSSDSATLVPTQQSVKAYVDAQVTAEDLDFQGDSGGALSIDLDSETMTFTGGTGIDTSGSGNAVTFAIDSTVATLTGSQTLTNKTLTSPDVNTPDIDGGTIDGTVIGGSTAAAGTFTTFTSNGIDDNADAVAITIDSSERTSFTSASNRPISAVSTDTNAFVTFQDTNSASIGHVKIGSETDDMVFYADAQERMRIKASNVGIGTTNPDSDLHIAGSTAADLRLERNDTTIGNGNAIGNIQFEHQETGYAGVCATFGVRAGNNNGNGEFVFLNGVAGTVTEKMRIDRNGNVGIGSASNHAGARVVINDTPPTAFGSPMFQVGQETFVGNGIYSIGLGYTGSSYTEPPAEIAALSTSSSGGTTADIIFGTRSVTTNTAVTERMRITSTGVVKFENGITEQYNAVTSSSNATAVDLVTGTNFSHTLSENTTFTFSNPAQSGKVSAFTLKIVQDASASGYTITWPGSVDWPSATAPTLTATANAVDYFVFITHDGGTNYYGFTAGQAMG